MAMDIFLQTAIYGGDPLKVLDLENPDDAETVADPVGTRLEKQALDELKKSAGVDFDWSAPISVGTDAPLAKNHPHDRETIERNGKQLWTYTYRNGALVKFMVQDPDLPGGLMHFDGEGNEIIAA